MRIFAAEKEKIRGQTKVTIQALHGRIVDAIDKITQFSIGAQNAKRDTAEGLRRAVIFSPGGMNV